MGGVPTCYTRLLVTLPIYVVMLQSYKNTHQCSSECWELLIMKYIRGVIVCCQDEDEFRQISYEHVHYEVRILV